MRVAIKVRLSMPKTDKVVVDVITEVVLGITFKKVFYTGNIVEHYVNDIKVKTFSVSTSGRSDNKELLISIIS